MADVRSGQPAIDESVHALPGHVGRLTAAAQRAMPQPGDLEAEGQQARAVVGHIKVAGQSSVGGHKLTSIAWPILVGGARSAIWGGSLWVDFERTQLRVGLVELEREPTRMLCDEAESRRLIWQQLQFQVVAVYMKLVRRVRQHSQDDSGIPLQSDDPWPPHQFPPGHAKRDARVFLRACIASRYHRRRVHEEEASAVHEATPVLIRPIAGGATESTSRTQ